MVSKNWGRGRLGDYGKILVKGNHSILDMEDIWKIFQFNCVSLDWRKRDSEKLPAAPKGQLAGEGGSECFPVSHVKCIFSPPHLIAGRWDEPSAVSQNGSRPHQWRWLLQPVGGAVGSGLGRLQGRRIWRSKQGTGCASSSKERAIGIRLKAYQKNPWPLVFIRCLYFSLIYDAGGKKTRAGHSQILSYRRSGVPCRFKR